MGVKQGDGALLVVGEGQYQLSASAVMGELFDSTSFEGRAVPLHMHQPDVMVRYGPMRRILEILASGV